MKCLGRLFKDYRMSSGFSIRSIAKTANISHTIVFDIEQGKITPNPTTLAELFDVLKIPFYDDPEVLWPLRDLINEFFYSFHHKEDERIKLYYKSLLRDKNILLHSPLRPHFIFAKIMYLVEFQQLDATELIEELDYLKEFFIPIQKQSFLLLKGINAFNNKKFTDAFRFFNKSKDEDVYDDITFLANYYVAFTADKFFKKELSLYYSFMFFYHF